MSSADEYLQVMRERHWRQQHHFEDEPDYCGGCSFAAETGGNHDDCPVPETMKADCSYRLREQAEALADAAKASRGAPRPKS